MKGFAHLAFHPSWHLRLNKLSLISNYPFIGAELNSSSDLSYLPAADSSEGTFTACSKPGSLPGSCVRNSLGAPGGAQLSTQGSATLPGRAVPRAAAAAAAVLPEMGRSGLSKHRLGSL